MTVKEQEEVFQEALSHYRVFNDKKSRDIIWMRVYEACKANAKKLLKVSLDDMVFHDRLMTAVDSCIGYILYEHPNKKGVMQPPSNPRSLVTFCYLPTLAAFCGPKAIKEDKEESYESYLERSHWDILTNIIGEVIDGYNL